MNKHYLMSKFKSTGTAYLLWFFFGCHYAYLGKWGIQILYWLTLGGFGLWILIDLFLIPGKVNRYNARISAQIAKIEGEERDAEFQRNSTIYKMERNQTNS